MGLPRYVESYHQLMNELVSVVERLTLRVIGQPQLKQTALIAFAGTAGANKWTQSLSFTPAFVRSLDGWVGFGIGNSLTRAGGLKSRLKVSCQQIFYLSQLYGVYTEFLTSS